MTKREEEKLVQALGAAISFRKWPAVVSAYADIALAFPSESPDNRAFLEQQAAYHDAQAAAHKRGEMMSMAESVHGENFHTREAERLRGMITG